MNNKLFKLEKIARVEEPRHVPRTDEEIWSCQESSTKIWTLRKWFEIEFWFEFWFILILNLVCLSNELMILISSEKKEKKKRDRVQWAKEPQQFDLIYQSFMFHVKAHSSFILFCVEDFIQNGQGLKERKGRWR